MQRLSGPVRFQKNPDGNALYRQMDYQRVSASELYNDDAERGKPSLQKKNISDQPQSKTYPYCFCFFQTSANIKGLNEVIVLSVKWNTRGCVKKYYAFVLITHA